MKELTEFDVVIATTEIEICATKLQQRLVKIRRDAPQRTDLIEEFTEERKYLLGGILTFKRLKNSYEMLSLRFKEIVLENVYKDQENKRLKEENAKLKEQINQMTKF